MESGIWNLGILESWNHGILESWNLGILESYIQECFFVSRLQLAPKYNNYTAESKCLIGVFSGNMITISYEKLVPRISNEDKQTISDKTTHYTLSFAGNL